MIRLLIVEDHPVVRAGICGVLGAFEGIVIAGQAEHGSGALELLELGMQADLVLCDIEMPVMDGISFARNLRLLDGMPPVVMLTMGERPDVVQAAFMAGAKGYLVKSLDIEVLVSAIGFIHSRQGMYCCGLKVVPPGTFTPIDEEVANWY